MTTCEVTQNEVLLSKEAAKARVYLRRPAGGLKLVRREEEFAFPEAKEYLREIRIHRFLRRDSAENEKGSTSVN